MSKNTRIRTSLIILGALLVPFFFYKNDELKKYNFFEGKVISIDVTHIKAKRRGRFGGGRAYEERYQPTVQYIRNNDTIVFTENRSNFFAKFYDIGDSVEVAQEKERIWNARIYSVWYFLNTYEILIILLIWGILYGFVIFITKKQ
ncbi:hypothetical protein GWA97_06945 [Flavobacterium sp. LaA7.5]|nr:hypothetical protein [Flavobacterium salilacus subsp. altitudinum]